MSDFQPDREDDFVAGWLLAWKAVVSAGGDPPDPADADTPPELAARLARGVKCLTALRAAWPTAVASPPVAAGAVLANRFEVIRELGRGGFGIVYHARDRVLGREVSVKVPRPESLDPAGRRRFALEAEATARLDHPNVVAVLAAGADADTPFIAAEYHAGLSLSEWVRRACGPAPWREAAGLVGAVAGAVHHAHARGVLHRDLKPANVLLAGPGLAAPDAPVLPLPAYTPKVVDFGLAKLVSEFGERLTASGVIPGTPAYMAPELFGRREAHPTTAADVYALGAVLYELLAGRPAFAADTPLATLELVRTADPPPLRPARPDVPADLETVCLKCLSKRPAERYASAGEVADELARALRGEPVRARRATAAERLARGVRRHPVVAGLTAALFLTLAVALGVTGVLLDQTRRERDRAVGYLRESLEDTSNRVMEVVNRDEWKTADRRAFRDDTLRGYRTRLQAIAEYLDPADPRDAAMLAECELRLSDIAYALGEWPVSRNHAERAVELFDPVARDRQNDPVACQFLMAALINQARTEHRPAERDRLTARVLDVIASPHGRTLVQEDEDSLMVAYFLYDVAVAADWNRDTETTRQYLAKSNTELARRTGGDSRDRRLRAYQTAHNYQLLCQIERCAGDLAGSVVAGDAAVKAANAACVEWPEFYQSWSERCGAHLQCGVTLKVKGDPAGALKVWEAGYKVTLPPTVGSPTFGRHLETTLQQTQLVLAFHLGLGYNQLGQKDQMADWFGHVVKLGRDLRSVCPTDWQSRYYFGIGCVNLAALAGVDGPSAPPGEVLRLREGLDALEQCLADRPAHDQLASELGYSWDLYARGLAATGEWASARTAANTALRHQWRAFLTRWDWERGGRLIAHLAVRLRVSGRNGW